MLMMDVNDNYKPRDELSSDDEHDLRIDTNQEEDDEDDLLMEIDSPVKSVFGGDQTDSSSESNSDEHCKGDKKISVSDLIKSFARRPVAATEDHFMKNVKTEKETSEANIDEPPRPENIQSFEKFSPPELEPTIKKCETKNDNAAQSSKSEEKAEKLPQAITPIPIVDIPIPIVDIKSEPIEIDEIREVSMTEDIDNFLQIEKSQSKEDDSSTLRDLLLKKKTPTKQTEGRYDEAVKTISIIDSLLAKTRRSGTDNSAAKKTKFQQMISESDDDLLVEMDTPVRYRKSSNPNKLPTPIIRNQKMTSAFVNSEEEYHGAVAKHKPKQAPKSVDKNQMGLKSVPPNMKSPDLPNIPRPRTLAEKRELVNKTNHQFLMVEQEGKIYRQVQRKKQNMEINHSLINSMMVESVPVKPGPWKVLTWLRTREGKFIQQYVNCDGTFYKLNGARGNHKNKFLPVQSIEPLPKYQTTMIRSTRCCVGGRVKKRLLESLANLRGIRKFVLEENNSCKRLDSKILDNQLISIKPRPLCHKIEYLNNNRKQFLFDEDSAFLGNYSKYEMPDIKLQVEIKPKTPLDIEAKKYLNLSLPHRELDKNWSEFALSALATKDDDEEEQKSTFEFTIPYQDNKKSILVREILHKKEDNEPLRILPSNEDERDDVDEMEWTFAKDADKDDPIECEVVEIIKDLTNSVFINLNDDLFTQEDPFERTIASAMSPIKSKQAVAELSSVVKPTKSKRVLAELRRLNANVFQSDSACVEDENDMRRHATAHLGKIERELRPTVIVTGEETVVLGNQEKESRRIKRVPKKFDDYMHTESKHGMTDSDDEEAPSKKLKLKADDPDDLDKSVRYRLHRGSNLTFEETKMVKREIQKMIHVSVDVQQLESFEDIEPFCMYHELYKCHCGGLFFKVDQAPVQKLLSDKFKEVLKTSTHATNPLITRFYKPPALPLHRESPAEAKVSEEESETDDELVDNEVSQRVIPVDLNAIKKRSEIPKASAALFKSELGVPKMELTNLSDLINGGKGPIFINVFDDETTRLNPILRSVLNNRCSIVYFEGFAYFLDATRVNVNELNFESLKANNLEHPIFVVQAKSEIPPPVSSTMSADFVNVLFKTNSDEVIEITEKAVLKEIANIIDSILRNVKKKIETQIGENPNEHLKEQLSMISREPSRSRTSSSSSSSNFVSSTNSSPLHFRGQQLAEYPPPRNATKLMKEFNNIFTVRMKRLVALVNSNTLGLRPSNEMLNKFYIYRWSLLLKSFEEDLIQIWQVKLETENGSSGYQMLVLTDTRSKPEVEHAVAANIVNIRKISLINDKITELTRLILLRIEKASMKNMTLLMYGCKGYLRICGILNSKEEYCSSFVAKPTRETHPRVAAKVQKIYHIWQMSRTLRIKQQIEKEDAARIEKQRAKMAEKVVAVTNGQTMNALNVALPKKQPGQSSFKWFLFNITNDFSDIYIKTWSRYLSYKVIMEAITRSKQINRAVALTPSSKGLRPWPRIYALPEAPLKFKEHDTMTSNYLIFGPYSRTSNSNLLLMQNFDGELMLRDDYEKKHNVERSTRTRCLWIYANSLKCIHDADPTPLKLMWGKDGTNDASKDGNNSVKISEDHSVDKMTNRAVQFSHYEQNKETETEFDSEIADE